MQWGVYQDFADSLGYAVNSVRIFEEVWTADVIDWRIRNTETILYEDDFSTDQEARNAAIEKFNEIRNEG